MATPTPPAHPAHAVHPAGAVLTVLRPQEVVIWLIGEIDVNLAAELDDIARRAPQAADRLTIDGSRVTFGDSTLLHFIALMTERMLVVVRRPSRILIDILTVSGLGQDLSIWTTEGGRP